MPFLSCETFWLYQNFHNIQHCQFFDSENFKNYRFLNLKIKKWWNQSLLIKSKTSTTLVVINLVQVSSRYFICHKFFHDDFSCAPHGFHEFVYCPLCSKMKTIVLVRYVLVLGPSSKLCLWWLCDVVNQQTNNYHCWLVLYFFSRINLKNF